MIVQLDDIIEKLADELGVYGAHTFEHTDGSYNCRVCWTSDLRERILAAVEVECKLGTITLQSQTPSSASCNNEQLPEERIGGKA